MVKLYAPGPAGSVSHAGVTYDVVDGVIDVPYAAVAALQGHGFLPTPPSTATVDTAGVCDCAAEIATRDDRIAALEADASRFDAYARRANETARTLAAERDAARDDLAHAKGERDAAATEVNRLTEALAAEMKTRGEAEEFAKLASEEIAALKAAPPESGKAVGKAAR